MGMVPSQRHTCHGFPYCREREYLGRFRVQRVQGHERVEAGPTDHPAIPENMSNRPVWQSFDSSTSHLHQLEARPRCYPLRCTVNSLGPSEGIHLSSIQSHIENLGEGNNRQYRDCPSSPSVASPTLVASSTQTIDSPTGSASKLANSVEGSIRSKEGPPNVPRLAPPHAVHMNRAGNVGAAGVQNGKLIQFQHL